jgi:tRNA threonylcarbamoyladenosine biosynthesis protein TsaB
LIVLALDTALAACSVCLFDAERDKVLASESALIGKGHAEALLPMLERVVAKLDAGWQGIGRFGVVVGPGSYTGLRVGISAARAAALATGRPSVGITSFAAFAAPLVAVSEGVPIAVAIDAKHGNVFFQIFSPEGRAAGEPAALSLELAVERVGGEPMHLAGSGASLLQAALSRVGRVPKSVIVEAAPDIVSVAKLTVSAHPRMAPADPLYIKGADARTLAEQAEASRAPAAQEQPDEAPSGEAEALAAETSAAETSAAETSAAETSEARTSGSEASVEFSGPDSSEAGTSGTEATQVQAPRPAAPAPDASQAQDSQAKDSQAEDLPARTTQAPI